MATLLGPRTSSEADILPVSTADGKALATALRANNRLQKTALKDKLNATMALRADKTTLKKEQKTTIAGV